ncbi:hypothetical protein EAVNVH72_01884 [Elizabethkingia anophelis]|nr:hypothetical protein EAVNVH72_02824 [Elizabethkingia anophelis]CAI9682039.1 hypothetical protein EAVNVH72_01884 [Elizabethkingia anophelis]
MIMDNMIEQIRDFKKVLGTGIDIDLFYKLILHCADGSYPRKMNQYANNMTLEEWNELYKNAKIEVSIDQLKEFFEYLIKYYHGYFSRLHGEKYIVTKQFEAKKTEEMFELEYIVYYSINS